MKLSPSFYTRDDVVAVASDLLGKVLCTRLNGELTEAIIIETEAYAGVTDKASHAYGGRRTKRTEPLFGQGGTAYVYLCYGIHHLFNVVTNEAETPHAVLIRAGTPMTGTERMLKRRKKEQVDKTLLAGPGSLAKALGITTGHTGVSLLDGQIWIEDRGIEIDDDSVVVGPRVGVDYAGDDAQRPYRFRTTVHRQDYGAHESAFEQGAHHLLGKNGR
jgi:DNA-3-methyladenine glycosylase